MFAEVRASGHWSAVFLYGTTNFQICQTLRNMLSFGFCSCNLFIYFFDYKICNYCSMLWKYMIIMAEGQYKAVPNNKNAMC